MGFPKEVTEASDLMNRIVITVLGINVFALLILGGKLAFDEIGSAGLTPLAWSADGRWIVANVSRNGLMNDDTGSVGLVSATTGWEQDRCRRLLGLRLPNASRWHRATVA